MKKNCILPMTEKLRLLEIELDALRTRSRRLTAAAERAAKLCNEIDKLEDDVKAWNRLALETARQIEEVRT